jgi:hypothetical protein
MMLNVCTSINQVKLKLVNISAQTQVVPTS